MIRKLASGEYRVYSRKKNPRTGRRVRVAAKRVPFFKVGKELRVRVDGEEDVSPTTVAVGQR